MQNPFSGALRYKLKAIHNFRECKCKQKNKRQWKKQNSLKAKFMMDLNI